MSTVYVALYDEDWNNNAVTGVYADLEYAKATLTEEYQRPGRTLEWREQPPGLWCLRALGEGGPDRWLEVSIQAHEVKP